MQHISQSETWRLFPGVEIGEGAEVGDFAIIGVPPQGKKPGELKTTIGHNVHIRSHTVVYAGNVIGNDVHTGHGVMIRECNEIGNRVSIGTHSIVEHHVRIEDDVRIHSQAFIPEYSVLERGCWIGPNVVLTNAVYPLSLDAKKNLKGPVIRRSAKIGANSTILPGVVVGANALVGAGAVVVSDVADGKVVIGNPARVIKDVVDLGAYSTTLDPVRHVGSADEERSG